MHFEKEKFCILTKINLILPKDTIEKSQYWLYPISLYMRSNFLNSLSPLCIITIDVE